MMARSEKWARWLLLIGVIVLIAWGLGGCSPTPPEVQTRIVEVPSSAPYRFITWSPKDEPETQRQVRAHNRRHQAVINAEREAKAKAEAETKQ